MILMLCTLLVDYKRQCSTVYIKPLRVYKSSHNGNIIAFVLCLQVCDFTGDPNRLMTFLDEMKNCVEVDKSCDLSSVFDEMYDTLLHYCDSTKMVIFTLTAQYCISPVFCDM